MTKCSLAEESTIRFTCTKSLRPHPDQLSRVWVSLLLQCITRLWKYPVAESHHDLGSVRTALLLHRSACAAADIALGSFASLLPRRVVCAAADLLLHQVAARAAVHRLRGAWVAGWDRSTDGRHAQARALHHHLSWARIAFFLHRTRPPSLRPEPTTSSKLQNESRLPPQSAYSPSPPQPGRGLKTVCVATTGKRPVSHSLRILRGKQQRQKDDEDD